MWTERFVRSLKYDARPRTTVPIEPFNRVVAITFDTTYGAESQYVNCMACVVITLKGFQPATERPCRVGAEDS